jgi:hypothetical protein
VILDAFLPLWRPISKVATVRRSFRRNSRAERASMCEFLVRSRLSPLFFDFIGGEGD